MIGPQDRDLRAVLDFVHAASSTDGDEPFPDPILELLGRLISGEVVGYYEWDYESEPRLTGTVELPALSTPSHVVEARKAYCSTYPLSMLVREGERRPLKISDFLSLRELHRLEYYDHVLRPFSIEHQLRLWLSAPGRVSRFFQFSRSAAQGDFGQREREILGLLRPFLDTIRERFGLRQGAAPIDRADLTDREAEILRWVAHGKTNQEIAMLLFVSPHTIRKHLENAYRKLGAHNRTTAVALLSASPN